MTVTDPTTGATWRALLDRWDTQQGVYVEGRERGFAVMLSVLDALLPDDAVVLDLASGPGSISQRVLADRPGARCVAVDMDPVLHAVGQGALGDADGRLRWVRADLRDPAWTGQLGEDRVDAVLSATATHWLEPAALAALYRSLAEMLPPGGVLLNFDGFPERSAAPRITEGLDTVDRLRQERALAAGADAWQDWWDAPRELPALAGAFAERDGFLPPARGRVFATTRSKKGTSLAFHRAALQEAGFAETAVVWQDLQKQILLAVR